MSIGGRRPAHVSSLPLASSYLPVFRTTARYADRTVIRQLPRGFQTVPSLEGNRRDLNIHAFPSEFMISPISANPSSSKDGSKEMIATRAVGCYSDQLLISSSKILR